MPRSLSIRETVKENLVLKKELEIYKLASTDIANVIDKSAAHIRRSILDTKWSHPWPIHPSDVAPDKFPKPDFLIRFLKGVLTGDQSTADISKRTEVLINSFSQDLIFTATNGHSKPPKHILTAYAVKTLTGNVEIIQMLNRLGHAVSYSQIEENDTALCMQKIAANLNNSFALPQTIQPCVFTTLAWDNIDRLEETLTGGGTTHRVNGIIIQPRVYGPHLPSAQLPAVQKKKQKTITQDIQPLTHYISGQRKDPPTTKTTTIDSNVQEGDSGRKDLI